MYNPKQHEKDILDFWKENNIFEKSVESRPEDKPYVFYDGPPFATGAPHYGHILSSVIKDVVPRYFTMKGYRVRRRWGWDCHGLPIESLIEKELNISGKKDIEEKIGVDGFNEACKSKVLMYTQEWKKMVDRIGRWVEFDNSYKTMDPTYMESVWWALQKIWNDGRIYEGRKVLMYCTRCETPVSKAEIAMDNSYKDITEETATVMFKVRDSKFKEKYDIDGDVYLLAWTTTPWTLPGNVALAVGEDITYRLIYVTEGGYHEVINTPGLPEQIVDKEEHKEYYVIVAEKKKDLVLESRIPKITSAVEEPITILGSDLIGLEYEPLFDIPAVRETGKRAHYVTAADFVTTEEGTGIVHTAVIYGEDDYNLGLKIDLPMIPILDSKGHFNQAAPEFIRGEYLKKAEKAIKADLESRGLLFAKNQHTHSYPHCWRCDTPLIYNAISAWFIDIQSIKQRLIDLNKNVSWYPDHLKNGRFLNILETAPDWNISRNRYWATPLPFWKCQNEECKNVVCIGSVKELKERATNFDDVFATNEVEKLDLHKQYMDKIVLRCEKCAGDMARIPEVIDCWVEAASMPFAEFHYPFENEKVFKERFPGQFIAEYINQTRAWFYYMHAMSALLFDSNSFEHVVTTGVILNEKGEKMSKSKRNFPDPWGIIDQYGTDALRYYLMTSPVMDADNLFFNEREVKDIYNKVMNLLWNVVEFYRMNAETPPQPSPKRGGRRPVASTHVLDAWILAKLQLLTQEVTENMDAYNTVKAGRPIKEFIDELSTWYVRRSRDRFKTDGEDREYASATLRHVLLTLSKLMAPFTPFIAEKIYQEVQNVRSDARPEGVRYGGAESVHLEMWPEVDEELIREKAISDMNAVRKIVEMGHSLRKEAGIPVRQVLSDFRFQISDFRLTDELSQIIADELNVKQVGTGVSTGPEWKVKESNGLTVALDAIITPELQKEGLAREIVRAINNLRKEKGLTAREAIVVEYETGDELLQTVFRQHAKDISAGVLAKELRKGEGVDAVEIDGIKVRLKVV